MTEDTRREKNRVISMFQMISLTGRQVKGTNQAMPRRLCSCLTLYEESCHPCSVSDGCHVAAAASLGCDWRLHGNQPGVLDKLRCWDVGLRVSVQQGTGESMCLCALWYGYEVERNNNDKISPVDLCFCETPHLSYSCFIPQTGCK